MSTDDARRGAGLRRYRRGLVAVLGVLALLSAGLGTASALQGPRLSGIDVNTTAVTERAGQRLTLQANQPLEAASGAEAVADISISPEAGFEAAVEGDRVTITLDAPLHYASEYTVTARLRGLHTGAGATLSASFATADPEVMTLVRGDGDDRIEAQDLVGGDAHGPLFAADRIQEYAALPDRLVVVALDAEGRPELGSVERRTGAYEPMRASGLARVHDLRVEPHARMAGYIAERVAVAGQAEPSPGLLLLHDMNDPSGSPIVAVDADGKELDVEEWSFVPDTTRVRLRTATGERYEFEPGTGEPAEPVDEAPQQDAQQDRPSEPGSDGADDLVAEVAHDGGAEAVIVRDEAGEREVFRPASETSRLGQLCPSPNREYLAVQVISAEGQPDGYPVAPGSTQSTVSFVRVSDGSVVRSMNGMMPSWCRE